MRSKNGLTKRGNIWHLRFTAPNGEVIRRSCKTKVKKDAQEYFDRLKAEYWRRDVFGEKRYTWNQAAGRYLEEFKGKDVKNVKLKLRWLDKYLGGKFLDSITRDYIYKITGEKNDATANRYSALIRAILNKAEREWEWGKAPKIRMRPEPRRRVRYLTAGEVLKLIEELPSHLKGLASLAWYTGLRMSNITELKWSQIHDRTVVIPETKNGEALGVYLNDQAMEVILKQMGQHDTYVFTYKGKPIKQVSTKAWKKAKERAGIKDFRFHDLRHTWASHHVQNGTPLYALQEAGGWKSPSMVRRYAHLSAMDFAEHAEKIGTKSGTVQKVVKSS